MIDTPDFSKTASVRGNAIEDAVIRFARAYTLNTPIKKGKYRLMLAVMGMCRHFPKMVEARMKDGRRLAFALAPGVCDLMYFFGEYEPALTSIVARLIRLDDTCIDVGANIGPYTTLLARLVGPGGTVHAFEPVPATFKYLQHNVGLFNGPCNIVLNDIALGDKNGVIGVNMFQQLGLGYSSISDQDREDAVKIQCKVNTLDSYLEEHSEIDQVNFVKVDIEGAEMMFLRGASRLFAQDVPPILLIEMSGKLTKYFGYHPNDLIRTIRDHAGYAFYAVDESSGRMNRINEFANHDDGANVFCIPIGHYQDRLKSVV